MAMLVRLEPLLTWVYQPVVLQLKYPPKNTKGLLPTTADKGHQRLASIAGIACCSEGFWTWQATHTVYRPQQSRSIWTVSAPLDTKHKSDVC